MDEMRREQLKSSICRKTISYCATTAATTVQMQSVSDVDSVLGQKIHFLQKNASLVIISITVKQTHLEMSSNCQLIWLAIRPQS